MDHKHPLADSDAAGDRDIVYVRPVDMNDLPDDVREQAEGVEDLYSVHDAQGQRLALVRGRELAFVLARQNDMTPVSVH
jgi:hypothetical protein